MTLISEGMLVCKSSHPGYPLLGAALPEFEEEEVTYGKVEKRSSGRKE